MKTDIARQMHQKKDYFAAQRTAWLQTLEKVSPPDIIAQLRR